ncbi:MAG: ThuA domain-containing protein, partial [Gammaproteobacteria bacterium]
MSILANITRRSALAALAGAALPPLPGKAAGKAAAFALIGDRYHNSDYIRTALTRTIAKEMAVTIDFTDETSLLNAETLDGCKVLIVLRDGMIWPDGYGGDESTNAAWVAAGRPKLVFDPPLPQSRARSQFWMKPEQGKAVRQFVEAGGSALFLHNTTHIGLSGP